MFGSSYGGMSIGKYIWYIINHVLDTALELSKIKSILTVKYVNVILVIINKIDIEILKYALNGIHP